MRFGARTGRRAREAVCAIALTCAMAPASATELLRTQVLVPGSGITRFESFSDARSLIDALDAFGYRLINPDYRVNLPAMVNVDFRGVPLVVDYPTGGPEVVFEIPSIGVSETFDAFGRRFENEDALVDFLEANEDDLLSRILGEAVSTTPHDPVAGTPNSLMGRMIEADFVMGTTIGPEPSQVATANDGYDRTTASFGISARFGRFTAAGAEANVIDLPLNYAQPLDDPRYAVIVDAPFTYVETEDTNSFSGSLGLGLRLPLYDNWSITPAVRTGVVGSVELGSAAILAGASITSNYRFSMNDLDFAIGNSLAYVETFPIEIDGTTFDYDLQNVVLRNGISVSGPLGVTVFGQPTTWEGSVVNTLYFGSDLYAENVTDIAISFGTVNSVNGFTWDSLRVGVTYTFSTDSDYQGLRLNFGYRF